MVSVLPNTKYKLHTTRSWDFLGLFNDESRVRGSGGGDVIIGVLDTGRNGNSNLSSNFF